MANKTIRYPKITTTGATVMCQNPKISGLKTLTDWLPEVAMIIYPVTMVNTPAMNIFGCTN